MRRLRIYRQLEAILLDLDVAGDLLADDLRDLMDTIWYRLTDEEHALLEVLKLPTATLISPPAGPIIRTDRVV